MSMKIKSTSFVLWVSEWKWVSQRGGRREGEGGRERVNEWVRAWVSEWVGGWVSEWMSRWVSEWVGEWVSGVSWVTDGSIPSWWGFDEIFSQTEVHKRQGSVPIRQIFSERATQHEKVGAPDGSGLSQVFCCGFGGWVVVSINGEGLCFDEWCVTWVEFWLVAWRAVYDECCMTRGVMGGSSMRGVRWVVWKVWLYPSVALARARSSKPFVGGDSKSCGIKRGNAGKVSHWQITNGKESSVVKHNKLWIHPSDCTYERQRPILNVAVETRAAKNVLIFYHHNIHPLSPSRWLER